MKEKGKNSATTMMMMVEREALIVHPKANPLSLQNPKTKRPARFLNPSLTNPDDPSAFDLPLSAVKNHNHDRLPAVSFSGFRNPLKNWSDWVGRMQLLHRATWLKAGIHDAIIQSTYSIPIHKDLILGLAQSWCSSTNTFVFPWAEATVSLEDVTVLGGYSVLGLSVLIEADDDPETVRITEVLMEARTKMNKTPAKKVTSVAWMNAFMGSGGNVEHIAFLVLWLSHHVFPFSHMSVGKHLHGMATRLAMGTRIALAPAVLASLYGDLTLLKQAIVSNNDDKNKKNKENKNEVINLWSPMQLVQIWAWERFPALRPQPKSRIESREPRMARWNEVMMNGLGLAEVRSELESSSGSFVWRPYAVSGDEKCWQLHVFYPEKEKWVPVGPGMREEFKSFARIVRATELVGINCLESYYPHRVSMQFGMDQDIPGRVACLGNTPEIAWKNYNRPIRDAKVLIPSKSFQSGVTSRYLEWWTQQKLVQKNVVVKSKGSNKRKAVTEFMKTTTTPTSHSSKKKKVILEDTPTPCFPSNSKKSKAENSVSKRKEPAKLIVSQEKNGNDKRKRKRKNADGNKVPDDRMPSSCVYLQKKIGHSKQRMRKKDENRLSDDCGSSSLAALQKEMGNDKQTPQMINDGYKISDDCRSSSCAELQIKRMNDKPRLERVDGNEIADDDRLSLLACDGADVQTDFHKEPTEVFEISIARCDKTGNEISDACTVYLPAEHRIQSLSRDCNDDDLQTNSHVELTEVFESTISMRDEMKNQISDGDKLSLVVEPKIPLSYPPPACNCDDVQMESCLEPIEVFKNTIARADESGYTLDDCDRLTQIQPSMLVCDGEQAIVCENTLTRLDEAGSVDAIERSVSIAGDNEETEISTNLNKMENIREKPLEDRITRLEILVALLKA